MGVDHHHVKGQIEKMLPAGELIRRALRNFLQIFQEPMHAEPVVGRIV